MRGIQKLLRHVKLAPMQMISSSSSWAGESAPSEGGSWQEERGTQSSVPHKAAALAALQRRLDQLHLRSFEQQRIA